MATYTLPVRIVRRDNLVLKDVQIVSSTDRPRSTANFVAVDVGARNEGRYDSYGSFSQFTTDLDADVPRSILSPTIINRRLRQNQSLVVNVETTGAPSSLFGLALEFVFAAVGAAVGPMRPLVSTGRGSTEPSARRAVEEVAAQINNSGVAEFTATVYLFDPSHDDEPAFAAGIAHSSSAQTVVAGGAYENANVNVTVTMPSWATIAYVSVTADLSLLGITATGNTFLAIGNGSVELTGEQYVSQLTTHRTGVSLTYRGTITATTTFKPRVKSDTNNSSIIRQTISYHASFA